ncbi:hypothetical protein FKW77_002939 [Venturia effusa]|uniref:PLAC8-domain-containing protein n=1 Tax=Venturia effusa TaxID=50376 RepID=A0A517LNK1_9PEZI|nr:hypothetical protein FKW77_002939 [Venturia effusa]
MASSNPRNPSSQSPDYALLSQRRSPLSINTSNAGALPNARGNRFSFAETPVEMNQHANRFAPGFQTSIQESPASASLQSQRFEPYAYGIGIAPEESQLHHSHKMDHFYDTGNEKSQPRSPYAETHPEPTEIHPAFFAPIDHSAMSPQFLQQQQQQQQLPSSHPQPHNLANKQPQSQPQQEQFRAQRASTLKSESDEIKEQDIRAPLRSSTVPTSNSPHVHQQPIFSPGSLAGPNGANPDLHRPGQVAHPNMTFSANTGDKAEWNHSMCECSGDVGTCATGFLPLTLRTRIRHVYKLEGNMGSDIVHSCCCCCCTAIQNEREVAEREDLMRVNAGPAQIQTQYKSGVGQGMVYAPHGVS